MRDDFSVVGKSVPRIDAIDKVTGKAKYGIDLKMEDMFLHPDVPVSAKFAPVSDLQVFRQYNQSDILLSDVHEATWVNLVRELTHVLDVLTPDIILAPHPVLDSHLDHKYTTLALFEAVKSSNLKNGALFLYTNHSNFTHFFPFGPAYSTMSLPPWFDDLVLFQRMYSHPLALDVQKEKLLALEAMHDLRPLPPDIPNDAGETFAQRFWKDLNLAVKNFIKKRIVGIEPNQYSYFRKAVRSNELFFVIPIAELDKYLSLWPSPLEQESKGWFVFPPDR